MSLDVYLRSKTPTKKTCSYCLSEYVVYEEYYDANITHNLGTMASKVEIGEHTLYRYLWRPEEINITTAEQLIEPLKLGLEELKNNPEKYKEFNPENGWGSYDNLVGWLDSYLKACIEYPDSKIEVSR